MEEVGEGRATRSVQVTGPEITGEIPRSAFNRIGTRLYAPVSEL